MLSIDVLNVLVLSGVVFLYLYFHELLLIRLLCITIQAVSPLRLFSLLFDGYQSVSVLVFFCSICWVYLVLEAIEESPHFVLQLFILMHHFSALVFLCLELLLDLSSSQLFLILLSLYLSPDLEVPYLEAFLNQNKTMKLFSQLLFLSKRWWLLVLLLPLQFSQHHFLF